MSSAQRWACAWPCPPGCPLHCRSPGPTSPPPPPWTARWSWDTPSGLPFAATLHCHNPALSPSALRSPDNAFTAIRNGQLTQTLKDRVRYGVDLFEEVISTSTVYVKHLRSVALCSCTSLLLYGTGSPLRNGSSDQFDLGQGRAGALLMSGGHPGGLARARHAQPDVAHCWHKRTQDIRQCDSVRALQRWTVFSSLRGSSDENVCTEHQHVYQH